MPQPHPDYYRILGVEPTATARQIGIAFRQLMRDCHPDLFPGDRERERRAQSLSAAKSVLGDPVKRAAYDARRSGKGPTPKPPPSPKPPPPRPSVEPERKPAAWMPATPKPRGAKLAVEYKGQRMFVGKGWRVTLTKMHRKAIVAQNPAKRPPPMKIARATFTAPGVLVVQFAYGKGRRKTLMPPDTAKFFWGRPA